MRPRAQRRERLKAEVARLFALHEGRYGSRWITADLREAGWRVSENTIAALMREQHLAARRKKKRKGMTRPGKGCAGRHRRLGGRWGLSAGLFPWRGKSALIGEGDRLGAVACVNLGEQVVDVTLDGALADDEVFGDLTVRHAGGDQ